MAGFFKKHEDFIVALLHQPRLLSKIIQSLLCYSLLCPDAEDVLE